MTRAIWTVASTAAMLACLGGCAIADIRADNDAARGRIAVKTTTLASEEQAQAQLTTQRDQLMADLDGRRLTLTQLSARLDALGKANDAAPVATAADRQRKQDRAKKLTEMKKQTQTLDQAPGLSQDEKARRADALKEQTRKALELLLVG